MKITVLFFGALAEVTETEKLELPFVDDTSALNELLLQLFPLLKNKTFRMAVNKKLINGNIVINEGDTIALLPPFSGG
jgi:molybdopterin synthase sulfur carrier subunit